MAVAIVMPALEMAQETGVLVRWLKREGDTVNEGEAVMEVETDKSVVEIESPGAGILGGVRAGEGDVVPVGRTIAWLLAPDEEPPALVADQPPSGRARNTGRSNDIGRVTVMPKSNGRSAGSPPRLLPASPKARRLAAERGIDLRRISGSGPNGAVLASDVVSADGRSASAAATYETPGSLWRVMADRMSSSWSTVPHFYLMREVEASRLLEWRERARQEVERRAGVVLTLTDLLVKSVAVALRNHPRLNAAWDDGTIKLNGEVNVGIAAALDEGLVVPVIAHADSASLTEIAVRRSELLARARGRKLRPEDMANGTFTVTNLGMYNVDAFSAIVNPPQAAILAVGRIAERVVPVEGTPEIRPMMMMTLSCDHRAVDGARAARFLDELGATIQDPWRLLI